MLTENFFDSDGVRLHYIDYGGEGPPLVLLGGLGGTAQLFRGLAPKLSGRFRVAATDGLTALNLATNSIRSSRTSAASWTNWRWSERS